PFHCPWDSGQIGFIFVTVKKALEWFGWKRLSRKRIEETLTKALVNEVKEYHAFVSGEVYRYVIKNEFEDIIEYGDEFYSSDPVMEEECRKSMEEELTDWNSE